MKNNTTMSCSLPLHGSAVGTIFTLLWRVQWCTLLGFTILLLSCVFHVFGVMCLHHIAERDTLDLLHSRSSFVSQKLVRTTPRRVFSFCSLCTFVFCFLVSSNLLLLFLFFFSRKQHTLITLFFFFINSLTFWVWMVHVVV